MEVIGDGLRQPRGFHAARTSGCRSITEWTYLFEQYLIKRYSRRPDVALVTQMESPTTAPNP
ncbi:hypothetical protein CA951_42285 [Rhodococcus sp. NCIMB 12038]|nr:hypothetical protein CA951_42285 [Rhodococcus sp. NCIMB 12038]